MKDKLTQNPDRLSNECWDIIVHDDISISEPQTFTSQQLFAQRQMQNQNSVQALPNKASINSPRCLFIQYQSERIRKLLDSRFYFNHQDLEQKKASLLQQFEQYHSKQIRNTNILQGRATFFKTKSSESNRNKSFGRKTKDQHYLEVTVKKTAIPTKSKRLKTEWRTTPQKLNNTLKQSIFIMRTEHTRPGTLRKTRNLTTVNSSENIHGSDPSNRFSGCFQKNDCFGTEVSHLQPLTESSWTTISRHKNLIKSIKPRLKQLKSINRLGKKREKLVFST